MWWVFVQVVLTRTIIELMFVFYRTRHRDRVYFVDKHVRQMVGKVGQDVSGVRDTTMATLHVELQRCAPPLDSFFILVHLQLWHWRFISTFYLYTFYRIRKVIASLCLTSAVRFSGIIVRKIEKRWTYQAVSRWPAASPTGMSVAIWRNKHCGRRYASQRLNFTYKRPAGESKGPVSWCPLRGFSIGSFSLVSWEFVETSA